MSRRFTSLHALVLLVILPLAMPQAAGWAETNAGAISGSVRDAASGDPLPFANVALAATERGAVSAPDGSFRIGDVAPGAHVLEISMMGYAAKSVAVTVVAGGEARVQVVLRETDVTVLDEIEVRGDAIAVDVESSTSRADLDVKQIIRSRAINTLQEALAKEPGVVLVNGQLHVRGGRPGETKTLIDGLPVSDPFVGVNSLQVSFTSLSEINLLSGGFDAEYGEAQSGIINLSTAEGGRRFSGLVKFMTDDFGAPDKTYYNSDDLAFGLGGPLMRDELRYYVSGQAVFTDTYLPLERARPKRKVLGITLSDRQNNRYQGQGKLTYLVGGRVDRKLSVETLYSRDEFVSYQHAFSRVGYWSAANQHWWFEPIDTTYHAYQGPSRLPDIEDENRTYKGVWTQSLSATTFYSLRGSLFQTNRRLAVGEQLPFEYDSFSAVEDVDRANDFFAISGDYPQWQRFQTKRWTGRGDLSSQIGSTHKLKTGFQLDYYDLNMFDAQFPSAQDPEGFFSDRYQVYAWGGSAYLQDRLRHEGMIINGGLRFDWFDPGVRAMRIGNASLASRFFPPGDISFGERVKTQVSPRVGMAYPITDRDVLHFHYGRFFQLPDLNTLYSYLGTPIDRATGTVGNVFIEPENTISYELGVDHQLADALSLDATVFFKDIFGLIGTEDQTQAANASSGASATRAFVNKDYGTVKGLELKLERPLVGCLGGSIVYTASRASGVSSNIDQGLLVGLGRQDRDPIREVPLDWDRTHAVSANVILADPGIWEVSTDWTYLSGAPFTPTRFNQRRTLAELLNSGRIPATSRIDLRANKLYTIYGEEFRLFLEGNNVLNQQNVRNLDPGFWPTNDPLYEVYFTESGGLGGAYSLSAVSASAEHELVPLGDPQVFDPGRSIRMGVLVDW